MDLTGLQSSQGKKNRMMTAPPITTTPQNLASNTLSRKMATSAAPAIPSLISMDMRKRTKTNSAAKPMMTSRKISSYLQNQNSKWHIFHTGTLNNLSDRGKIFIKPKFFNDNGSIAIEEFNPLTTAQHFGHRVFYGLFNKNANIPDCAWIRVSRSCGEDWDCAPVP